MADFARYAAAGYGPALVPIVPHDANIADYAWVPDRAEGERRREQLTSQRGKVPGKRLAGDVWTGFANFTAHVATPEDHLRWTQWGAGVGVQARYFPALDIDVVDEAFVANFLRAVQVIAGAKIFGRVGRRPRILIPFRAGEDLRKLRLELPTLGLDDRGRSINAVELLANGQQYVVDGIHPKTGQPYTWGRRGFPEAVDLPLLDAAKVERIFATAAEMAGVNPLPTPATNRLTTKVEPTVSAPNFEAVAAAVKSIPNDLVYDTWISLGHAIKNVTDGSAEGFNLWAEWSALHPDTSVDACAYKWESFRPPYNAGWDTIRALVPAAAASNLAAYDFTEAETPVSPLDAIFERYVWVEKASRAFDRETRTVLDDLQFSVRNNHICAPRGGKATPWTLWLSDATRLQRAASVTYRPGGEMMIAEKDGVCVNTWVAPNFTPRVVSEDEASPWVEHVAYLVPDETERTYLLDWLAFIVQNPGVKPNWQVVWGSRHHGVGKDMALEPVRRALGQHNVRNVHPEQILSQRTDWFENARLVVVEEMKSYGKRELENRLRPFLASPPEYVPISKVYMPTYDVPNIAAVLFLTNEDNALPISKEDRRHFVVWCDDEIHPRDEAYYVGLASWYEGGGTDIAASWLMQRDLSAFNAKGRAPMTAAKQEMIGATMSPLEAWIEDGIRDGEGPFRPDIIEVGDLLSRVPKSFGWDGGTPRRLAQFLQRCGGVKMERTRLGKTLHSTESDRGTLYILRRHEMYSNEKLPVLVELFWKQRADAEAETLRGEFDAVAGSAKPLL